MGGNDLLEFHKMHRAGQDKYTYFILAVTASAVAFAVQKTEDLSITYYMIPLGTAVISWGFSFYFGIRNLYLVQTCLTGNYSLLQLQQDENIEQTQKTELSDKIKAAIGLNAGKAHFFGVWQFRLLIIGAILFLSLACY
ncbi:MAG: hypothetical protein FVQ81_16080 [Candidatus Glassbacteria bacterium]|nr:hypothetical protein [Candidatus Glassbacteria bacterium]